MAGTTGDAEALLIRRILELAPANRSYDDLLLLKMYICKAEIIETELNRYCNPRQMSEVCRHLELESYSQGETVFHQGGAADKLYIILTGVCDVKLKYKIDLTQGETEIREKSVKSFSASQYFGEECLVSSESRQSTVVAASAKSDLIVIPKTLFVSIIEEAKHEIRHMVATKGRGNLSTKEMVISTLSKVRDKRTNMELEAAAQYLRSRSLFFQKFTLTQLMELGRVAETVTIYGRSILFKQGHIGRAFYVILSGTVSVWIQDGKGGGSKTKNYSSGNKDITYGLGSVISDLGAGDMFGEAALESADSLRTASIVTCEDSTDLFVLAKDDYINLILVMTNADSMNKVQLLRKTDVLKSVEAVHLRGLSKLMEAVAFKIDEVIYRKGQLADCIIIIEVGECKVEVEISEGRVGEDVDDYLPAVLAHGNRSRTASVAAPKKHQTVNVGRIAPNSVLGAYTLLTESFHEQYFHAETITAASNITAFKISKHDFFMHTARETRRAIQRVISEYTTPTLYGLWQNVPRVLSDMDWRQEKAWKKYKTAFAAGKKDADMLKIFHGFASLEINTSATTSGSGDPGAFVPKLNIATGKIEVTNDEREQGRKKETVTMDWGLTSKQKRERQDKELRDAMTAKQLRKSMLLESVAFKPDVAASGTPSKQVSQQLRDRINGFHQAKRDNDTLIDLELNFYSDPSRPDLQRASSVTDFTTRTPAKPAQPFDASGPPKTGKDRPFCLLQLHKKTRDKNTDLLKASTRTVQCCMRICGTMDSCQKTKEYADMYMENIYITMAKCDPAREHELLLDWKTFLGYDRLPLNHSDHFLIFCRGMPVEYASLSTSTDLYEVPFPAVIKQPEKNWACVLFNYLRDEKNVDAGDEMCSTDSDSESSDDEVASLKTMKKLPKSIPSSKSSSRRGSSQSLSFSKSSSHLQPQDAIDEALRSSNLPTAANTRASLASRTRFVEDDVSSHRHGTVNSGSHQSSPQHENRAPDTSKMPLYLLEVSSMNELLVTFRSQIECMQYAFERFGTHRAVASPSKRRSQALQTNGVTGHADFPDSPGVTKTSPTAANSTLWQKDEKRIKLREPSEGAHRDRVLQRVHAENKTVCVVPMFEWFVASEDSIQAMNFLRGFNAIVPIDSGSSALKSLVRTNASDGTSSGFEQGGKGSVWASGGKGDRRNEKSMKQQLLTSFAEAGVLSDVLRDDDNDEKKDYITRMGLLVSQEQPLQDVFSPNRARQRNKEQSEGLVHSKSLQILDDRCQAREVARQVFVQSQSSPLLLLDTSMQQLGASGPGTGTLGGTGTGTGAGVWTEERPGSHSTRHGSRPGTADTATSRFSVLGASRLDSTASTRKGDRDSTSRGGGGEDGGSQPDTADEMNRLLGVNPMSEGKLEARLRDVKEQSDKRVRVIALSNALAAKEHRLVSDEAYRKKRDLLAPSRSVEAEDASVVLTLHQRAARALQPPTKASLMGQSAEHKRRVQLIHDTLHVVTDLQAAGARPSKLLRSAKELQEQALQMAVEQVRAGTASRRGATKKLEASSVDRLKTKIDLLSATFGQDY